ncbi:PKH4B protein, partial [Amia calva]|nr:PKH4B protein [Amia calva]
MLEMVNNCFLTQFVTEPTRECACIDLIFSNDQDRVRGTLVREPMANCDHNMVSFEAYFQKTRTKSKTMIYNFRQANLEGMRRHLDKLDWSTLDTESVENGWLYFQNILLEAQEKFVPTFNKLRTKNIGQIGLIEICKTISRERKCCIVHTKGIEIKAVYSDVLFRFEGWPLCLRERVVIQLASLNPLLLRPGDFYLQVQPFGEQAARIVLKSLLEDHREVEETPVPETSYPSIFTKDWLEEINQGRHGTPLHTCLLSTDQGIVKVPWAQVASPEFVDKPKAMASSLVTPEVPPTAPPPSSNPSPFSVETRILPAKDGIAVSLRLVDGTCTRLIKVDQPKVAGKPIGWVSPNTWDSRNRELEGDYVDLVEFTKERAALALSRLPPRTTKDPPSFEASRPLPPASGDPTPCGRTAQFSEEPCTPCLRRKLGHESKLQELRCRYRESYMAALQNPVNFEREDMAPISEESAPARRGSGSVYDSTESGQAYQTEPQCQVVSNDSPVSCRESGKVKGKPCCTGEDSVKQTNKNEGIPSSPSPSPSLVSESPRKCSLGQSTADIVSSDVCTEMIPTIHVVHCKKTTVFGLVSPKVDRWKSIKKEAGKGTVTAFFDKHQEFLRWVERILKQEKMHRETLCSSGSTIQKFKYKAQPNSQRTTGNKSFFKGKREQGKMKSSINGHLGLRMQRFSGKWKRSCRIRLLLVATAGLPRNVVFMTVLSHSAVLPTHFVTGGYSQIFIFSLPDVSQVCRAETEAPTQQTNGPEKALPSNAERTATQPASRSCGPGPGSAQEPGGHLLHLGIACLPGSRDRAGRAVVEVYGDHHGWKSPLLSSQELCKLLLHFYCIPRKDVRDLGMTLVTDARRKAPPPALFKALLMVQEQALHAVHGVLILVDKETSPRTERHPGLQVEVMTSLKALHKVVEGNQLTASLEGTFPYSHSDWMQLYQKLDPFVLDLREASSLLQKAIRQFEGSKKINTIQEVQQCIQDQKTMMKEVLEDTRLVALQRQGGAILARLRKEEPRFTHSEDYRYAMECVTSLYNQVEDRVHMLVMRSNQCLQHLDFLLKLRELEGRFKKIREWFDAEGERRLLEADSVEDSLERVEQTLQSFKSFLNQASEQKLQAMTLVKEAEKIQGSSYPEMEVFRTMVYTFKSSLADFLSRAEQCHTELETMVSLYQFCEKATELAKDCRQYLEQARPSSNSVKDDLSELEKYHDKFTAFSTEQFQEVKAQACTLKGSRGMRLWNVAWLKVQEVRQQLEERVQDFEKAQGSVGVTQDLRRPGPEETLLVTSSVSIGPVRAQPSRQEPTRTNQVVLESRNSQPQENDYATVTCFNLNFKPDNKSCKGLKTVSAPKNEPCVLQCSDKEGVMAVLKEGKELSREDSKGADFPLHAPGNEWFPWHQALGRSLSEGSAVCAPQTEPQASLASRAHSQPSRKILQAARDFQISRHGSFCSDDSCCPSAGDTGDLSKATCPTATHHRLPICQGPASMTSTQPGDNAGNFLELISKICFPAFILKDLLQVPFPLRVKLQRIMEELLLTEREYVRSLGYIIAHYFPQMERPDVPQDLRGQRGRIFGNLEKLHDFHRHFFLKALEGSVKEPLRVGRCFLRHMESFGLYALYSKNKPQSDSLLIHHGHDFFKQKQLELGDKMDLSSYLLKPVQRISKYNLLLQDMVKECGPHRGRERAEIQGALEVIRFQLRHGNDLLAMDDILDCDVNLKEQGQLIRQDEFLVSFRKKKCFRHIFLFQDLILFSKTKKTEVGNDVYIYKQSFKTSDIGMTHNAGDSGLCFEIWFRRRKSHDTYILQAESGEVKEAWTRDLERILWEQAVRNREIRMQERVFMGIGSKPFMDIKPSEAAISDRAVNCVPTGRESRALSGVPLPTNHELLLSPRPNSIGSGSSLSSSGSHTSSSSGRGSLPPHSYLSSPSQRGDAKGGIYSMTGALEEDDLDNDTENLHLLCESPLH